MTAVATRPPTTGRDGPPTTLPDVDRGADPSAGRLAGPALAVAVAVAAHGFESAYRVNQNTYLLHAVALAQGGPLRRDWIVRSTDPTPVFSRLVAPLLRAGGGPLAVYVLWVIAAVVLFGALWWADADRLARPATLAWWAAGTAVVASRFPWLLSGVAGQYALGPYLQPSTAGVLLVAAVVAMARRGVRPWTVGLAFTAALVHPTYLLGAWCFTTSFAVVEAMATPRGDRRPLVLRTTFTAGLATVPPLVANWSTFRAGRGPAAHAANTILVERRIPHHALVSHWLHPDTVLLVAAVVLVLALLARGAAGDPRTRLARGLVLASGLTVLATAAVAASADPTLELAFPWRTSVVIIPLTVALALAAGAEGLVRRLPTVRPAVPVIAALGLAAVVAASGVRSTLDSFADPVTDDPVVAAVRHHRPVGVGLVPIGLDTLRLNAGVRLYVDFKNHPIAASDVLRWSRRIDRAEAATRSPEALCRLHAQQRFGWMVLPADVARGASRTCLATWTDRTRVGDLLYLRRPSR